MKIVVYTALVGPADEVVSPPASDVRYICVTDRPSVPAGWTVKAPPAGADSRHIARLVKHTPSRWCQGADVSVWMDASFDLVIDPARLVEDALATGTEVIGFVHPDRQRISQEAKVIINASLAPADKVRAQLDAYQAEGFDTHAAQQRVITTTGLLVRRHTPAVSAFQKLWREQLERHTLRDQLSGDYCAWKLGLAIGYLRGSYRENAYAVYQRDRHRLHRTA